MGDVRDPNAPEPGVAWPGETTLRDLAGLAPDERVELTLSAGPWTVLRKLGPDEVPQFSSLVLAGTLQRLAVPDVLSLVNAMGLEGELVFTFGDAVKRVHVRGGNVVFASSSLVDDRLGEILLARGSIDRATFDDASAECVRDRKKFGRVLVDRGILSAHDVYEAVTEQVETILLSLFTYVTGTFVFTAKPVSIANPIRLPNPMSHYILEGVRLSDELHAALEQVSDRLAVLRPKSGRQALSVADGRPGVERDVAGLLDGMSPIWEVLARSTWSEANTLLALARLLRAGMIEKVRASEASLPAKLDTAASVRLIERVNDFLRDAHRSVAAFGGNPRALSGYFDGIKPALRGLFAGTSLGHDGSLDAARIAGNLGAQPGTPAEQNKLLREGLQEVVEFALWVASDQVPEKDAMRLADEARNVREGQIKK